MKTMLLFSWLSLTMLAPTSSTPDQPDAEQILTIVELFAKSADQQDVRAMEKVLHSSYRAVLNQLFGSEEVSLLDRATYLSLLKDKKIGGEPRKLSILSMDIEGKNASVKVQMEGAKATFISYLLLVKSKNGQWQIIGDMPTIG